MIWGPPKIHHAAFPMAAGRFGRALPFLRVNYDLIVNKSCETGGPHQIHSHNRGECQPT
jgi:hypothetical protein